MSVILIDGPSGSGKSALADRIVAGWPEKTKPVLVRLDDIYPGWDGLFAASQHVFQSLLLPRSRGDSARWQQFDWHNDAQGPWHEVAEDRSLIVEGCGVLTARTAPLADVSIWVEADDATRKARALDRDGELYAPHWDRWDAQWQRFVATEDPRSLATLTLDTSA